MESTQAPPVVEETHDEDFVPKTAGAVDGVLMPIYVVMLIAYSVGASWLSECPWYTFSESRDMLCSVVSLGLKVVFPSVLPCTPSRLLWRFHGCILWVAPPGASSRVVGAVQSALSHLPQAAPLAVFPPRGLLWHGRGACSGSRRKSNVVVGIGSAPGILPRP